MGTWNMIILYSWTGWESLSLQLKGVILGIESELTIYYIYFFVNSFALYMGI